MEAFTRDSLGYYFFLLGKAMSDPILLLEGKNEIEKAISILNSIDEKENALECQEKINRIVTTLAHLEVKD